MCFEINFIQVTTTERERCNDLGIVKSKKSFTPSLIDIHVKQSCHCITLSLSVLIAIQSNAMTHLSLNLIFIYFLLKKKISISHSNYLCWHPMRVVYQHILTVYFCFVAVHPAINRCVKTFVLKFVLTTLLGICNCSLDVLKKKLSRLNESFRYLNKLTNHINWND